MVKAVAETDCIGCREVIIRAVMMMIEDVECRLASRRRGHSYTYTASTHLWGRSWYV